MKTARAAWRGEGEGGLLPADEGRNGTIERGRDPRSLLRRPAKTETCRALRLPIDGFGGCGAMRVRTSSLVAQFDRPRVPRKTVDGLGKWDVQAIGDRKIGFPGCLCHNPHICNRFPVGGVGGRTWGSTSLW